MPVKLFLFREHEGNNNHKHSVFWGSIYVSFVLARPIPEQLCIGVPQNQGEHG
jgi:hypothetical protein